MRRARLRLDHANAAHCPTGRAGSDSIHPEYDALTAITSDWAPHDADVAPRRQSRATGADRASPRGATWRRVSFAAMIPIVGWGAVASKVGLRVAREGAELGAERALREGAGEIGEHVLRHGGEELPTRSGIHGAYGPTHDLYGGTVIGPASGRRFNPDEAGGPIRSLTTDNVRVTHHGIDVVERYIARFDPYPPNDYMLDRLRQIANGNLTPTTTDINFYTHELREFVRYRRLGWLDDVPENADEASILWNNTPTATLEDYRFREGIGALYDPRLEPLP